MIELRNGKLYDGKTEVKPQVGNPEHIKALREAGAYIQPLIITGRDGKQVSPASVSVTMFISASVEFECSCGSEIEETFEDLISDDSGDLSGEVIDCGCGKSYILFNDGGLFAREVSA